MPKTASQRCTVLLSGGIDSAVLAVSLVDSGWAVDALWIDYGQPAAGRESTSSRQIAEHLALPWSERRVRGPRVPRRGEIPGRNDLLVAMALIGGKAGSVAIGIHSGTDYSDCSPEWVRSWQDLLAVQYGGSSDLRWG